MHDIIGDELYSLLKKLEKLEKRFESIIDGSEVHMTFVLGNRVIENLSEGEIDEVVEEFPQSESVLREYLETHIDYLERVSGREDLEHDTHYHTGQKFLAHLDQTKLSDFHQEKAL